MTFTHKINEILNFNVTSGFLGYNILIQQVLYKQTVTSMQKINWSVIQHPSPTIPHKITIQFLNLYLFIVRQSLLLESKGKDSIRKKIIDFIQIIQLTMKSKVQSQIYRIYLKFDVCWIFKNKTTFFFGAALTSNDIL